MKDTNAAGGAAASIVILSKFIARILLFHQLVTIQWQWYVLLADIILQDLRLCVSDSSEYCQHKITKLQQKILWMQYVLMFFFKCCNFHLLATKKPFACKEREMCGITPT